MKNGRSLYRTRRTAATLLILAGWACGDSSATSPEGPPGEEEPTPPVVAAITVSSDLGPEVAPGATAELTAVARDAAGAPVNTSFTWSSSDSQVATVALDGTMRALAPGDATITASVGDVSGELAFTVSGLDVAAAEALLDDAMAEVVLVVLGTDGEAAVGPAWEACQGALRAGDVTALSGCLAPLNTALAEGDPASAPLRAVLTLFIDTLDRILASD